MMPKKTSLYIIAGFHSKDLSSDFNIRKNLFVTKVHDSNWFGSQVWLIFFPFSPRYAWLPACQGPVPLIVVLHGSRFLICDFRRQIRAAPEEIEELILYKDSYISPFLVEGPRGWTSPSQFFTLNVWLTDSQAYGLGFLEPVRRLLAENFRDVSFGFQGDMRDEPSGQAMLIE